MLNYQILNTQLFVNYSIKFSTRTTKYISYRKLYGCTTTVTSLYITRNPKASPPTQRAGQFV